MPGADARTGSPVEGTGERTDAPLLEVRDLVKHFPIRTGPLGRRRHVHAVDGVSFDLFPGETLGLVGESGCGKSTTGRAILRLVEPTSGVVRFRGRDVGSFGREELRDFRRRAQLVFQDPYGSLNPRMSVGGMLEEALFVHRYGDGTRHARRERAVGLLELVGLGNEHLRRHPHEFSGGQRQRLGIARALAVEPELLVLDEPVSALDVSVRAQVINLLDDLQRRLGLTYLLIAHDLALVEHVSDRVAVMYLGRIVEIGTAVDLYRSPGHPYTQALLSAVPRPDPAGRSARKPLPIRDEVASPIDPPSGCPFRLRCEHPLKDDLCAGVLPAMEALADGHFSACHHQFRKV